MTLTIATLTQADAHTTAVEVVENWQQVVELFIAHQDVAGSSRHLYTRTLQQFTKWLHDTERMTKIANMTLDRSDILDYKNNLLNRGLSPLTVGSYIVAVRKFFAFLESAKIYPNIAATVKTPHKPKGFTKEHLTDAKSVELLRYEQGNNLRDFALVNLLLRTGLRTIEVERANIGDVTYEAGQRILLVQGKGHDTKDDFVVLTDKAWQPIAEYLKSRKGVAKTEPLFASDSRRNNGGRLTTRSISRICKEGLKSIGLDDHKFTAHSLRHTTACAILNHGGQLTDAQHVLRHVSPVTTQIYVESIKRQIRLQNAPESVLDNVFNL